MENASKALIIAGAILISILIVGLGVIIYQNVSGIASDTGALDTQKISAHNSPFSSYFGNSIQGANVRALITSVNSNNQSANVNDEKIGNYIYLVDAEGNAVTSSSIRTGRTYNVNLPANEDYSDEDKAGTAYWKNGFIKTIVIQVNG